MEAIKKYVSDNLPELAADVIKWRRDVVSPSVKIANLAKMINDRYELLDGLGCAEILINRAALEYVVRHHEGVE